MRNIVDVRFLGSTLALAIGALSILGGYNAIMQGRDSNLPIAGIAIVLGALVYRSRKRRILGERKSTWLRLFAEWAVLLFILAAWLLQNDLKYRIATDPVPMLIPALVFIAYPCAGLWHRLKRRATDTPSGNGARS